MNRIRLYICGMVMLLNFSMAYAQFNTIREKTYRYKVEVIDESNDTNKQIEVSQQLCDTSKTTMVSVADSIQQQKPIQIEERTKHEKLVSYPLRSIVITSPFGYRRDPFTGKRTFHNGIDLRANYEPVYSMLPGRVIKVSKDKRSGIYVTLQHGNFTVSYSHLSNTIVRKGDYLVAGQPVGISGSTGRSTGPHLHITIMLKEGFFNPSQFFKYFRIK